MIKYTLLYINFTYLQNSATPTFAYKNMPVHTNADGLQPLRRDNEFVSQENPSLKGVTPQLCPILANEAAKPYLVPITSKYDLDSNDFEFTNFLRQHYFHFEKNAEYPLSDVALLVRNK